MKCLVCSSNNVHSVFENSDIVDKKIYSYYKCKNCGVVFIHPLPSQERLNEIYNYTTNKLEKNSNPLLYLFYENSFFKSLFEKIGQDVNLERANFLENKMLNKYVTHKVFDIGCGAGRFLSKMFTYGWEVIGQDRSKKCLYETRMRINKNIKLYNKDITKLKLPRNIGVVTMWHVFEHMTNFKKVIQYLSNNLKDKTYLIIECPNSKALSIRLFKHFSPLLITPEHITFWSSKSFNSLLKQHRFDLINVSFPRTFLFTTASSAFKFINNKINNSLLSTIFALMVFPFSLFIYVLIPRSNESIRIVAEKRVNLVKLSLNEQN